jgi:hypothetical protein
MVTVRIFICPNEQKITYELEGSYDEILQMTSEKFIKLRNKIEELIEKLKVTPIKVKQTATDISFIQEFADLSGNRVQLSPIARKLSIREILGLVLFCAKFLGKETITTKEIHEILIENGIPYRLPSVLARLSEMTQEGLMMRVGSSTYKLSIFGESWIKDTLAKVKEGEAR